VKVCGSWVRGGDQGKYSPDPISFRFSSFLPNFRLSPYFVQKEALKLGEKKGRKEGREEGKKVGIEGIILPVAQVS
jgi:hypothetical protein